jgi:hypothetical protein
MRRIRLRQQKVGWQDNEPRISQMKAGSNPCKKISKSLCFLCLFVASYSLAPAW